MSNVIDDTLAMQADATGYDAIAITEIKDWMTPEKTVLDKALSVVSDPIHKAGEALVNAPEFGDTLKPAIEQTITSLSDAANWTIDTQSVLDNYKKQTDEPMVELSDIHKLPLQEADKQVELFKSKYVAATSAEGVTSGMAGWLGIPADIVALVAANLRAIGEYGTYYGFDMSLKSEQLFAMSLLSIATSHSASERLTALNDSFSLLKDPKVMALNKINEEVVSRLMRQTATQVATNLVKSKAAQVIPAVGAVVAGGVNAHYTANVCDAAYQCYRKRFLDSQAAK